MNVFPPVRLKRRPGENTLFLNTDPNSLCRRMKRDFHADFNNALDMPRSLLIFGYRYHPREQMEIHVVKIDKTLCRFRRMKMFPLTIVLRVFRFESPDFRRTTMSLSQLVRNNVSGDNIDFKREYFGFLKRGGDYIYNRAGYIRARWRL